MSLEEALRAVVKGDVRFDAGTRAAYATDASNYRQVPTCVVVPRDLDDVVAAVAACREHDAPVFSRGGGTSLGGQCTNEAVLLDFAKHVNAVESIDPGTKTAIVQPGIVLDELNKAVKPYRLVFGPKPATHDHCTIGGMVGNNSCGATAQWSGTTTANIRRLEVLTYDGTRFWVGAGANPDATGREAEIYTALERLRDRYLARIRTGYPDIPRRISGYNLPELLPENGFHVARALVGSESTCVTVLRVEVDLLPDPPHTVLVIAGYDDIATAAAHVPVANRHHPYAVEGLDHKLIEYEKDRRLHTRTIQDIPRAGAWLMVKTIGESARQARERADALLSDLRADGDVTTGLVYDDPAHIAEIDSVREAALGATARVPGYPDTWPGWEDSAVPPDRLADYLRDLHKLLDEYGYGAASLYGHFGHGCVHTSIPFDLTSEPGIAAFRSFVTRAAALVHSYGGSLSGEHGDGQARGELLDIMFGAELVGAMREFKAIFDPGGRMNPGKVIDPNPLDGQLRLGPAWPPIKPETLWEFPKDGGFAGVPTRCFGVGACRRHDSDEGVMCPSYMVTREEQHSTRGRMRLLFEMMRGEVIIGGWRSTEVNDALDLCLACKGCKSDCPVSVDMATYKSEFLYHHHKGRLRPRTHYTLGWLPRWARLARFAPWAANAATKPGFARRLAGIDPQRPMPRFASRTFTSWYRHRGAPPAPGSRGDVLLFPDTFTNHFDPHIARSAVDVLEAAGFTVHVPDKPVCCGLTWISTGQLPAARRLLRRTLHVVAPYLEAGMPVVGLEPSCTSVLHDDAVHLIGGDRRLAERLAAQTVTLAELLDRDAADFTPALITADGGRPRAIVQTHCHQHATLGVAADDAVLKACNIDAERLASGCCGLAGDFGMTPAHREVSLACAERVLFPALRDAGDDRIVLADGFSCRLQIRSGGTGHTGVHLAEVLARAVRGERPR